MSHGGVNRIMLMVIYIIGLALYFSIVGLVKCWRKNWMCKVLIIASFTILPTVFYLTKLHHSCAGWDEGIGGLKIDNTQGDCIITSPSFCELTIRKGWIDFAKFGDTCDRKKMTVDKGSLNENLHHKDIKTLGFPRVEDWPNSYRIDQWQFLLDIRDRMIDMDDPNVSQEIKDSVEFTIDMSRHDEHLLNIDVKRNETRATELKALRSKVLENAKSDPSIEIVDTNFLIMYIDGFSRPSLKRMLPKFNKYLEQFVEGNSDSQAYQFFRYHNIKDNTYYNNHALYYGIMGDFTNDTNNVFQYFSQNGFVTGLIRDQCEMDSIESKTREVQEPLMYRWDHYAAGFG